MSPKSPSVSPAEVAAALRESIEADLRKRTFDPENPTDLLDLAHSARAFGIVAEVQLDRKATLSPKEAERTITDEMIASYIHRRISPHPGRFQEIVKACQEIEAYRLTKEADKLESCGEAWGRIMLLTFLDNKGRERMRTHGLHSCKSRHCPRCGRGQQMRRTTVMEKVLVLASAWGMDERNIRFTTLTVRNGDHIPTLRKQAHEAFARLQRGRWWPKHVFGWFRGSECVTGENGQWNFHLHVIVILWNPWLSYRHLWDHWEEAVRGRAYVDMDSLKHADRKAKGKGFLKAAEYATKYLSKQDEFNKLKAGPGGFAHYSQSMRRVRAFAVGGGASLLRRLIPILMPGWLSKAERALHNEFLNAEGRPPVHVEEVNPETGEVFPYEGPYRPFGDSAEQERLFNLARELYTVNGIIGTVGEPCGVGKRLRRLGPTPLPSKAPTVAAFEAQGTLTGIRVLVAQGRWKVARWTEPYKDKRTGKERLLHRAFVLPAKRFAWRSLYPALAAAIIDERNPQLRQAYRAYAESRVSSLDRRDAKGLLMEALGQAYAGKQVELRRVERELDQERRKEVADPSRIGRLKEQRETLSKRPFAAKADPWAAYDAEVLGL